MAVYAQLADGRLLEFPDNTPPEVMERAVKSFIASETPPAEGLGAAFVGGAKRFGSALQTAGESLFDAEGAAKRGLERQELLGQQYAPATSLEAVKKAYAERGVLPAAGEAISQIPGALAEQFPNIAATLAGAKTGALTGARFGPKGAIVGGLAGAAAPAFAQLFGSGLERQAEEGVDISRGRAAAAAAPGAALEVASTLIPLGKTIVGKILGPQAEKALAKGTNESIERLAKETVAKSLAKGVGVGALAEIPTEVTQQMLERLQAGLPLTTDEALSEYGEAAYGAGLVGGPFGAVGRVAQRGVAKDKIAGEQAEERRLQEELAAAEKKARLTTPEYRQELNDKIYNLKDELAQIEPIAKDKTQDEDVRNEAIARAKEIKGELKDLQAKFKESMKEAGLTPTLAQAKAAGFREMPVVDEFGNIVKPKGKQLTEEEYGQKLEGAAKQWDETREKIFALREKEAADLEAKKEKLAAQVDEQVKSYLRGLDEYDTLIEQEKVAKGLKAREEATKEETQQRALDRIQKVIDNFGFNLLGFRSSEEVQNLKKQVEDLSEPSKIAAAPDRAAYLQQLDALKAQLQKAIDEAPRDTGEGLQRLIGEGVVSRDVTKALGIEGLEGKTYRGEKAVEALPNIQAAIDTLEEQRQKATASKQELMQDDGQLTTAGMRLVRNEVRLNELKRLKGVIESQTPAETAGEAATAGTLEFTAGEKAERPAVEIEPNRPTMFYKNRADAASREAGGSFTDLTAFMDDYRRGRFFGEKGAKRDVQLASSTRAELLRDSETARKAVIDKLIDEIAYRRAEQGLRPLTVSEGIKFAFDADSILGELVTRSTALPSGYFLEKIKLPAQMRGTEIVKSAETALSDTRDLSERQFGAPQRAVEVLAEMVRQARDQAIDAGKRPVRAEKPLLRKQFAAPPTDLVKDLDRVLRMENLQPEVRQTLEAAQRRMQEGGISENLEELLEEQVGRILRGTDRPFTLERDVTKPGGKRAMAAAGKAELIDEIKAQMRFDAETAQAAGEQMTVVPKGKEFREERVQPDLFPETVATERATPAMFQRLQKSATVQRERARIEEEKKKAKQAEGKLKPVADRIKVLEEQLEQAQPVYEENFKFIKNRIAEIEKGIGKRRQLDVLRKVLTERYDNVGDRLEALDKLLSEKVPQSEVELRKEFKDYSKILKPMLAQIKKENAMRRELDALKARRSKIVREAAAKRPYVEPVAKKEEKPRPSPARVEEAKKKVAQEKARKEEEKTKKSLERAKVGLGLPGVRGVSIVEPTTRKKTKEEYKAEMKAYEALPAKKQAITPKPTKYEMGVTRRVKVVPIKSQEEIEAEQAERAKAVVTKARASSPEAMFEKLKAQEKEIAQAFKSAKYKLDEFTKKVRGGEKAKNFPEFKKLSAEVNRIKANLNSIRDNLRLLKDTQYEPEKVKRQPARGPVKGEVKWYDKKFTPDQLRNMSNLGLSSFSTKTYSVDDSIDFAISDKEGGGIDLEQANKRMAEVEKRAKAAGIPYAYFPTMKDVTVDILKSMARQGVDIYETRIRGGVKPDGTVFVIGENHTDMTDLEKTIAHEFVGHYSFEGLLGEGGMKKLLGRVDKAFGSVFKLADTLGVRADADAAYVQGLEYGLKPKEAEVKALREVVAYTMEKRVDQKFLAKAKRWLQELVGAMRSFFKGLGMDMDLSTSDLFYMMKQANEAFEAGKPIAYKKADGTIDFRGAKSKYAPGLEDLGAITDKIIGRQEGMWSNIKANVTGLTARVQFVDRFAALEALVKRGVSKGIIDSLKAADVMYFSRMADQRHSFVAEIANNGTLKLKDVKRPDGRTEKIIESERGANLKEISQTLMGAGVGNAEATGRLFTLYLAAERAQRVGIDKLNFGGKITKADLDKALAFGRSNQAFQKARDLYNEYNKGLIDFAVQTGALSKEEGARLSKTNDYVPFYRMRGGNVELVIGSENPIRIGDIKTQPYLQELVGGDEAIMDFFTSSLQNTTLLTDMALRNLATRNAAFVLGDLGVLVKKGEKGVGIRKGDGTAGPNTIRFKLDGEPHHVVIDTQAKEDAFGDIPADLVVKGMEGMQVIVPGVVRGLAGPANWLRKFVTRDPRYAVRQIFRDSMAAALTTGADIKPVITTMGEIAKMYSKGGSEAFEKLQRRGILGGQVITGAPEDMAKIMQQIASGKPGWDMAMAKLDQFAMAGDAGTRMAMYNSFLKQGLSEREATLAALESMNFGRRGVSPSIYFLNATIPFFNAGIQGIDVLYRAFTKQMPYEEQLRVQKKLLMRGGMMALFTLAYVAMMQDDEAYKNAEPEQRYGNWFIRIPGVDEPFRVPIPFEVGLLFKAVPEGIYNAMFSDEKGSKVAKDLTMQLMRSLPGNPAETGVPVPTAIKPFIETALNKSFFTGRDIVDARLEGLEKEFQYRDKTPEILKTLGPIFSAIGLSPVQMENFVRAYTGSLGVGVLSLANPVLKPSGGAGEVEGRVSEIPLVGGLFQPNDAGRVINEAYDSIKEIQQKQGSFKKLLEEGKIKEAEEYVKANAGEIGLASFAGSFRQRMGELTKTERAIKAAPAEQLSPQEKRKQLDEIRKIKIQMANDFKSVREQIERQGAR